MFNSLKLSAQAESSRDLNSNARHDPAMTEGTEWQIRAKAAGLSQETLRLILGLSKSGVSQGIRGVWESGVPQSIKAAVVAWELMTPEQRTEWARLMGVE
jgi:hypothetical protein